MNELNELRQLLCALGDAIRLRLAEARKVANGADFAAVSYKSAADTIYHVDKISEEAIQSWFESNWPARFPVQIVMEGIDDQDQVTFPKGTPVSETRWKCIIDPIDGTRGIMYDKRSAWALAGIAPQKGAETRLSDIVVAAMTELPTSKQWRADQVSAVRGLGITAEGINVFTNEREPIHLRPSQAYDFKHGFAALVRFFPEARAATARVEEKLWDVLYGLGREQSPMIFDDQYISTGGQFYELLAGHDRMLGDLRPILLDACGYQTSLVCHPYDACTMLLLHEAGVIIEHPDGTPVDAPLDTTSPVTWVAYANHHLAELARPFLQRALAEVLSGR